MPNDEDRGADIINELEFDISRNYWFVEILINNKHLNFDTYDHA
jgi:hypothetical protein